MHTHLLGSIATYSVKMTEHKNKKTEIEELMAKQPDVAQIFAKPLKLKNHTKEFTTMTTTNKFAQGYMPLYSVYYVFFAVTK